MQHAVQYEWTRPASAYREGERVYLHPLLQPKPATATASPPSSDPSEAVASVVEVRWRYTPDLIAKAV